MIIKVSEQGNVIEITKLWRVNREANIKKLSADEYVRLSDGEICEFDHSDSRANSKLSLLRTFRSIRALVNTNFTGSDKEVFITLTYAENMTDPKRLYSDFEKFWKRFVYRWGHALYLSVVEPQARGAWHFHVCVKFDKKAPYIPNDELRKCWGKGFVNVRKLDDVDNIGAYLSAYLADVEVPLDSNEGEVKTFADGTKKRYVKGGRLHMYPPGMNIYRCSRGLEKPKEYEATEKEIEALVNGLEPTYAAECSFETEEGFKQTVEKFYYNKLRKSF